MHALIWECKCLADPFPKNGMSAGRILSRKNSSDSREDCLKIATNTADCPDTFTNPFPNKVAPKNSQNGIKKCPQQTPHKSKAAFGQEASKNIPQKPWILMKDNIHPFTASTTCNRLKLGRKFLSCKDLFSFENDSSLAQKMGLE